MHARAQGCAAQLLLTPSPHLLPQAAGKALRQAECHGRAQARWLAERGAGGAGRGAGGAAPSGDQDLLRQGQTAAAILQKACWFQHSTPLSVCATGSCRCLRSLLAAGLQEVPQRSRRLQGGLQGSWRLP